MIDKKTKDYLAKKLRSMRKKVSKFKKQDWKKFYIAKFKELKDAK